jgi:hypothetical protein
VEEGVMKGMAIFAIILLGQILTAAKTQDCAYHKKMELLRLAK